MKNVINFEKFNSPCTGCGLCESVCPTGAIKIELSEDGFYKPVLDSDKCINCSLCVKSCAKCNVIKLTDSVENIDFVAAKNKDKNELIHSSSGAVSIEIMRWCIKNNYKVVAVAYDVEKEIALHKIASSEEELEQFRGSKYFQSYTSEAFNEVVRDKSDQKYAIFGTPCQIYGFYQYATLRKLKDKFLFVDIFCHGCPSMLLWKNYNEYKKKKYKIEKFDDIVFRSKSYGWHEFAFDFKYKDLMKTSSKLNDQFYSVFFENTILNEACYKCDLRSTLEYCDIRMGDYWGEKYDLDGEGVSSIALCTDLGKKVFDEIKSKFDYEDAIFNEVIRNQSYGEKYDLNNELKDKNISILNEEIPFNKKIKKINKNNSLKHRLNKKLRSISKLIPNKIYIKIRKCYHNIKVKEK